MCRDTLARPPLRSYAGGCHFRLFAPRLFGGGSEAVSTFSFFRGLWWTNQDKSGHWILAISLAAGNTQRSATRSTAKVRKPP
jgi:hypothetical protein